MNRKTNRPRVRSGDETIANQVFLGIPWRNVRPKYERAVAELRKTSPLSFIIVGRDDSQDAEDLLTVIKRKLETSSYAIFDATGGNANVSYEYGFAEARDIPRALYLSDHQHAKKVTRESPIISDLAAKKQNRYKQENALHRLLEQFSDNHAYSKRLEKFLKTAFKKAAKGQKRRKRTLAMKLIHQLDGDGAARRSDVVQALQAEPTGYKREEIDEMILAMHRAELIDSQQGPHSKLTIR
jgi:hypothetical protein